MLLYHFISVAVRRSFVSIVFTEIGIFLAPIRMSVMSISSRILAPGPDSHMT